MALIKCPNCNKDISDKSIKCIHCGDDLSKVNLNLTCNECGEKIAGDADFCTNCGCPIKAIDSVEPQKVEITKISIGNGKLKKNKTAIIVVLTLIIICIVGFMFVENKKKESRSEEYRKNLGEITYKMLSGAADAESCANKIKSVWYNTIWKKDDYTTNKYTKTYGVFNSDFNDSLHALFNDSSFINLTNDVKQNQNDVNKFIKKLNNPPKEWEDAYDDLKDFYDNYLILTNLCINPSGSLQTYSNNFSKADADTVNSYDKMKTHLDY